MLIMYFLFFSLRSEVRAFLQLDRRKLSSEGDGELDENGEGVEALERMNKLNLGPSERL